MIRENGKSPKVKCHMGNVLSEEEEEEEEGSVQNQMREYSVAERKNL